MSREARHRSARNGAQVRKRLEEGIRAWELALVALVLLVVVASNVAWVLRDGSPPFEHSGRSIRDSVVLWQEGVGPDDYPPLSYAVSAAAYSVFGLSRISALTSQYVFLLPWLAGCWWIGRELGGRGGGVLTLLAAAGTPWMSLHLQGYFLEVGTAALVATAFALLLASRGGRRLAPTLALGVVLGLGMLSKWSFLFFVAPGLLWPFWEAWRDGGRSRALAGGAVAALLFTAAMLSLSTEGWGFPWKTFVAAVDAWIVLAVLALRSRRTTGGGLALALALGVLVSGWWYFLSVQELTFKAAGDAGQGFSASQGLAVLAGTLATSFWLAPLWLAVGLVAGLRDPSLRVPTAAAVAGILVPMAVYVQSGVPIGPRYLLPALPFVVAVSFGWWGRVPAAVPPLALFLSVVGLLQIGSWASAAAREWVAPLRPEIGAGIPAVLGPEPTSPPVASTAERILAELSSSGEHRITAIVRPGVRLDVDMVLMETALRGRDLDIEHLLPGRSSAEARTSLVLVMGDEELPGHERLECWEAPGWGRWCLWRHPTRRDDRPPPRAGGAPR